ncbi:hypothetical protein GCM10020295_12660 [Streptomyces cinereospinus]
MFLTSTRRYVLLMAATVLAAGATSLSAPAFAATASQNPKVPDTCGWILTDDGSNPCVSSGTSVARGGDTGAAPPEDPSDAGGEDTGTDQAPPRTLPAPPAETPAPAPHPTENPPTRPAETPAPHPEEHPPAPPAETPAPTRTVACPATTSTTGSSRRPPPAAVPGPVVN